MTIKDTIPLAPNHVLHDQAVAPEVLDEVAFDPKKCWRWMQELVRHFWNR